MSAKHFLAVLLLLLAPVAAQANLPVKAIKWAEQKPGYEVEINYPRTGHRAIDAEIETWARARAKDFIDDMARGETTPSTGMQSMELNYEVQRNDGRMFSVLFTDYSFTGGAHPNSSFDAFNFLLPDGMRVELPDLVTRKGIERISALSIAQLRKELSGPDGMSDTDWISKGAGPNPRNFANFVLKPNEIAIYFDAYQVAAYAAGPQEAHIPLAELRGMLRPDPRAPAASFDCGRAQSDIEHAICGDRGLAKLDRHVAEAYADKLVWESDATKREALKRDQRAWLVVRDGCRRAAQSFVGCLSGAYEMRLKALASD